MFFDHSIRYITSKLYRLVLVSYGIILFNIQTNTFPRYWYALLIVIYVLLYVSLANKKSTFFSLLRLLNDFIFIYIILLNKEMTTYNFLFLLFPIINTPNHTGEKRSVMPFIFTSILIYMLWPENLFYVTGIFFAYIITQFEYFRAKTNLLHDKINASIGGYNLRDVKFSKIHRVYIDIIDFFNKKAIVDIEKIVCFKLVNESLILINASDFVWKYSIGATATELLSKIKNKRASSVILTLDKKQFSNTDYIEFSRNNNTYIFALVWKYLPFQLIGQVYIRDLFKPFLSKIVDLLEFESRLRLERFIHLNKVRVNYEYIDNAILSMHFLRNRFSPIVNYFKMLNDYESTYDKKTKAELERFIKLEKTKVSQSIQEILNRTNQILEKSNNPLFVQDIKSIKLRKLYSLAKRHWNEFFGEENIEVEQDIFPLNEYVKSDVEAIEIVFDDLISNISKYSDGYLRLKFKYDAENFIILFENNVNAEQQKKIKKIIEVYKDKESFDFQITQTYGFINVHRFLSQMGVNLDLILEDKIFIVKLSFKRYKNENSDI